MSIYKYKSFARFARKENITDQDLCKAGNEIQANEHDANLGGGVFKQRVARKGGRRSGGFRTIVLFRKGNHTYFVYGFPKSARDNIRKDELEAFRLLAGQTLAFTKEQIETAIAAGELIEVLCNDEEHQDAAEAPD